MSLTDARREVSAMRATFSDAVVEAAETCAKMAYILHGAARGDMSSEDITDLLKRLTVALDATRDATMTWAAMDTLMREVEK